MPSLGVGCPNDSTKASALKIITLKLWTSSSILFDKIEKLILNLQDIKKGLDNQVKSISIRLRQQRNIYDNELKRENFS